MLNATNILFPPLHPKGGDVFLFKRVKSDDCNMDFRYDQMTWKQKGSNYHNIKKYGGKVLKRYCGEGGVVQ